MVTSLASPQYMQPPPPEEMLTDRPLKQHHLKVDLSDVRQGVGGQAEAAGVQKLRDQLLPVLCQGLRDELLPNVEVLLVLGRTGVKGLRRLWHPASDDPGWGRAGHSRHWQRPSE